MRPDTVATVYELLYARIPAVVTENGLAREFSDKELRVMMSVNGMLINEFRENQYNELR